MCESKLDTRDELLVCILDAAVSIKKVEGRLKQHSIFAQKLQGALCMALGFSNIYCEAQQIYHFCVTNFFAETKLQLKVKLMLLLSSISFFLTIDVFLLVDSNNSVSVTIQVYTRSNDR